MEAYSLLLGVREIAIFGYMREISHLFATALQCLLPRVQICRAVLFWADHTFYTSDSQLYSCAVSLEKHLNVTALFVVVLMFHIFPDNYATSSNSSRTCVSMCVYF